MRRELSILLAILLGSALANGCATTLLPGQPLPIKASYLYGIFEKTGRSGIYEKTDHFGECAILLTRDGSGELRIQGPNPLAGRSARAFVQPVEPGLYQLKGFRYSTRIDSRVVDFRAPASASFINEAFRVSPGEGIYLGDFFCNIDLPPGTIPTSNQVYTLRFTGGFERYAMQSTTAEIIDTFGEQMNGRRFRSLDLQEK